MEKGGQAWRLCGKTYDSGFACRARIPDLPQSPCLRWLSASALMQQCSPSPMHTFLSLPSVASERILYTLSISGSTGPGRGESYPDYRDKQSQVKSFAALGGFSRSGADVSDNNSLPTRCEGAQLTFNAFSIIGQKPIAGRGFLLEDAGPGAPPVVILSYNLWEKRYGKRVSQLPVASVVAKFISAVATHFWTGVTLSSIQTNGQWSVLMSRDRTIVTVVPTDASADGIDTRSCG
jgi:hypothetical protein